MDRHIAALMLADFWITTLCEEFDVDPEVTTVTVNAVSPDGRRELATRNLASAQEQIRAAIETAK